MSMLLSFIVYASQENGMGDAGGVAMKKKKSNKKQQQKLKKENSLKLKSLISLIWK